MSTTRTYVLTDPDRMPADPAIIEWIERHNLTPAVVSSRNLEWAVPDEGPSEFSFDEFQARGAVRDAHCCPRCDDWHINKKRRTVEFADGPPSAGVSEVNL